MTVTPARPRALRTVGGAPERQARYWNARYRSDPSVFGQRMSPFLRWVLSASRNVPMGRTWVELGSGYGRDLRALRARGYSVVGVDVSRVGTAIARRAGLTAVRGEALRFLSQLPEESVDVVFSNLFYNLEFSEDDHVRLFARVHRALVPQGLHAYSVRNVDDPWYGKGVSVGPDTFDLAPDGAVMHFFSRAYGRRLRSDRFRSVRTWEGGEDPGGFPIRVLYVLERKSRRSQDWRQGSRLILSGASRLLRAATTDPM